MKLLFLLFLAFNIIYLSFCADENHNKNEEIHKTEAIFIIPDTENGNCLSLCKITPNCRLYEKKNGMCELTVTRLSNNSTFKKLRVKRKGGGEGSAKAMSNSDFSSSGESRAARSSSNNNNNNGGGGAYRNSNYYGGDNGDDGGWGFFSSQKVMWIFIIIAVAVLLLAMFFAYMTIRENAKRGSRYRPPQRNSASSGIQDPNPHHPNNDMYQHTKPAQFYKKLTYTSKI
uniref:Apple domain-containing protein n=1 Tax=Panagrolaimus superbus TaxID=310955 RepID=A0A914YTT5_9BILA